MTVTLQREVAMASRHSGPSQGRDEDARGTADALLSAVARGDDAALGALYDVVGGKVYGTIRRVLRDAALSEEVTQEVMLEVWCRAARFDAHKGSATAWIVTIAHRRAIDRVRSEQASRDRVQADADRDGRPAFDEVSEQVELAEEHDQVRSALASLTERQREVIELAYYQGYTYREVAQRLDAPLGTIKTRMRDALIRMRGALEVSR
ncbi:MAG: ECF RNA polymerase sigma factor SigK [Nitriliruptoraceae bacterium]